MRDYDELVDRLRAGTYTAEELSIILPKAADAIEELCKRKWISVEDWPTKNVCDDDYTGYLVFSDGYIKVADYTCGFYVDGEYDPNVTHYMPLPKPPKEEKNETVSH